MNHQFEHISTKTGRPFCGKRKQKGVNFVFASKITDRICVECLKKYREYRFNNIENDIPVISENLAAYLFIIHPDNQFRELQILIKKIEIETMKMLENY